MSKSKTNASGFTLLETIIAITVISIGLFSIIKIFPLVLKISKSSEQTTVAVNLAQSKLEELFSLGYESIVVGTVETKHRLASDSANPFYYYQRQTVVEYVDNNLSHSASDTGIKKITSSVFWRSPLSLTEKNVDLILLVSQR